MVRSESIRRRGRGFVGLSVLVQMTVNNIFVGKQLECSKLAVLRVDFDVASHLIQAIRRYVFGPDTQLIFSWRHAADEDRPVRRGNRVVRRAERNDDGAHVWVNVAEDEGNSFAVELDGVMGMTLVKSEVEALAVEEREDIVKEGIEVGKLDDTADGYEKEVWDELLVFLSQGELLALMDYRWQRTFLSGREPRHNLCRRGLRTSLLALTSNMDVKRDSGTL